MKLKELNNGELTTINGGSNLIPFPQTPSDFGFYDDMPRPVLPLPLFPKERPFLIP